MLQAFVMVLREGFESFLIVAIILSYLKATGRRPLFSAVYLGVGVSLLSSGSLGYLILRGINQALWEGILGLITIFMVGTLILQMWRTAPRLKVEIQRRLHRISSGPSYLLAYGGVFLFTLLMISREGMETALMLLQVRDHGILWGILLGLAATIAFSLLWIRYSALINLKRFFQVTGIYLLLFLVQVIIYSFHEFSEAGLFPNSEAIHIATEPFSPVGTYGQWFSPLMIGVCAVWLLGGWFVDRLQSTAGVPSLAGGRPISSQTPEK